MPLEMLLLIFGLVVRRHFDDKDAARPPALCLRAVCRTWRNIVNAESSLWTIDPLYNEIVAQEFISVERLTGICET